MKRETITEPTTDPAVAGDVQVVPTQVRRPWRTTVRSIFQALVALAVMAPLLVQTAGLDPAKVPYLAGFLVVCAAITRLMALPQVEAFLRRFAPFLAAGATSR